MTVFAFPADGYDYRPLKLGVVGNDVIALQYLLGAKPDGHFGPKTGAAVLEFQERHFDDPDDHDSIAGIKTQRKGCLLSLFPDQKALALPPGLGRGMIEGESGFQVGNQSLVYRDSAGKLRADLGAVQFSTPLEDEAAVRRALNVPQAIRRLCEHLRAKHDEYEKLGVRDPLAWWLACGSWNAPAWTDTWARKGPGALQGRVVLTTGVIGNQAEWVRHYVRSKAVYTSFADLLA